jgi:hypothetical protein
MVSAKSFRHLLLALLIALSALAGASCSSLIGAEDYEDSAKAICGMVALCYGDPDPNCARRIHQRLDLSPPTVRSRWLSQLTNAACLESCVAARKCLDLLPICNTGGDCSRREDCCGFLGGTVGCSSTCCGEPGALCSSNADCCPGAGGCVQPFGTCGGVVCRQLDASCVNDFDCCSKNCGPTGRCEAICSVKHCDKDADCCGGLICSDKTCTKLGCLLEGEECSPGGAACCGDPPGLGCIPTKDGATRCATSDCLPPGVACSRDDYCCSDRCVGGLCSKPCGLVGAACGDGMPCCDGECSGGICTQSCSTTGTTCTSSLECCSGVCNDKLCDCSEVVCAKDENCCTGVCIGGACKPACADVDCNNRSVCQLGGPLGSKLSEGSFSACPGMEGCVTEVCKQDDYCCCGAWDALCVGLAHTLTQSCSC